MGKDIAFGEIPLLLEGRERLQKGHNHGQKSRDTFAFLGRFPIHTGPTPPPLTPHPTNKVGCVHSLFFFYRVGGEELQENFEKDALFYEGTEK